MDIKHKEVVDWLQEVYGEEQIPSYERTERSITILHQLMTVSRCSDNNAKTLAEDYDTKASEYSAEARQLKKWLDPVHISPGMLSDEGQTLLSARACAAEVLDVQIPTCTNIILAMNELEMKYMQVLAKRKQEKSRTSHLLDMDRELSKKLEEIEGIQQQAEVTWEQQQEEHAKNVKQEEFMEVKCSNYMADISSHEAKLNEVNMTSSKTHHALSTQAAEVQGLEEQVSQLEEQLKNCILPPDYSKSMLEYEESCLGMAMVMDKICSQPPSHE